MNIAEKVLVRPVITEKSTMLGDKLNRYVFVVDKAANKLEVKKAIESMYSVSVESINTIVMPAKAKTRFTKAGVSKGRKQSFKKAVVSLVEGDTIDFYNNI
jgi:large subunit ribosomal protein L23